MQPKVKVCKGCGKIRPIYAKGMCAYCYGNNRTLVYMERQRKKASIDKTRLHEFFENYWSRHKKRECYECGTPLYYYKHWHLHHVIPKRFGKNYNVDIVFNDKNIVYVCLGCHSEADHNNMRNTPKIKELYNKLKEELENGNF